MGRTESRPKDYEQAVVVEVEFNGTNKTTLRSEWGSAPQKRKKNEKRGRKNSKKNLTEPTLLEITANLVTREFERFNGKGQKTLQAAKSFSEDLTISFLDSVSVFLIITPQIFPGVLLRIPVF